MNAVTKDFATEQGHKQCRLCGLEKPLAAFSVRDTSPDGYRNDCKECRSKKQRQYSKTTAGRVVQFKADQLRNGKFKERRAARSALFQAVKTGAVERFPCFVCGEDHSEAHHPDYSMPLDVVWLCKPHHKEIHEMARQQ